VVVRLLVPLATMLVIGALSLLLLFTPFFIHPALDAADSDAWLGMTAEQAHAYSDRTIGDLFALGAFDFTAPTGTAFFTADERAHMRDVRIVLFGFLALALAALAFVALMLRRRRAEAVAAIGSAGTALVVGTLVAGVLAAVAFDAVFELFHRLLFPGGNFSFDPGSQRLVQLYPLMFWQITAAALGVLLVVGGLGAWLIGRRGRRLAGR